MPPPSMGRELILSRGEIRCAPDTRLGLVAEGGCLGSEPTPNLAMAAESGVFATGAPARGGPELPYWDARSVAAKRCFMR